MIGPDLELALEASDLLATAGAAIDRRRCLVVGSAPVCDLPTRPVDACVAVNGAISRVPKTMLHVVGEPLFKADTESRRQTLEQFRGRRAEVLAVSGHFSALCAYRLAELGYHWKTSVTVPRGIGGDMVAQVCGGWPDKSAGLGGLSTGLFAVCLTLWLGAESVVMAGYSLGTTGHYYNPAAPRDNRAADATVLMLLVQRWGARLTTTSLELHDTFQVPLDAGMLELKGATHG